MIFPGQGVWLGGKLQFESDTKEKDTLFLCIRNRSPDLIVHPKPSTLLVTQSGREQLGGEKIYI